MNNQNNIAQVAQVTTAQALQFINDSLNPRHQYFDQELANAILDFNTAHNNLDTLVRAIIEGCEMNNIAFNNIANNVQVIAEFLQNDDMLLSADESLDSDMQPRINVQNIQPNIQPAVNVQQNVVQPIANRTRTQTGAIMRQDYRGM